MDPTADDPRIGTVLQDRYRVVARISAGGMGAVYRGERLQLGRAVAIKFLHSAFVHDKEFQRRFDVEAQAMSRLGHPHCVSVIDFGVADVPYVVMEYVQGVTLRDLLEVGRLPVARALAIGRQVLAGLAHAHKQGIIHRDVKPANIMLTEATGTGDHVRILDFGLAKLRDGTGEESRSATAPLAIGTPSYMSPEQARGDRVDTRSDVYSAGVLLYELLTGQKPFRADEPFAIIRMHLEEPPPALAQAEPGAGFSDELERVIRKALAKAPDERYQSAAELADALDATPEARLPRGATALGRAETLPLPEVSSSSSAPRLAPASSGSVTEVPSRRRGRVVPTVAVVAVLCAGAAAGLLFARGRLSSRDEAPTASPPRTAAAPHDGDAAPQRAKAKPEEAPPPAPEPADDPDEPPVAAAAPEYGVGALPPEELAEPVGEAPDQVADDQLDPPEPAAAPEPDRPARTVKDVERLIREGHREEAIHALRRMRRDNPKSAYIHYLLGNLYFEKLWWTAGLTSYQQAVRANRAYRQRAILNKNVIKALGYQKTQAKASAFILRELGRAALPFLDRAAKAHASSKVRAKAAALAKKIRAKKKRR